MKKKLAAAALAAGILTALVYGSRLWVAGQRAQAAARALEQTAQWSQAARMAAGLMVERYGPPQEASPYRLRWDGPWPWKRIVVRNEPQSPLEQVVRYYVPPGRLAALDRFSHGLSVDAEEGTLAACGAHESFNLLRLNLANDIATGKISPEDADRSFARMVQLYDAGKSSPYMERLLFDVPPEPDRPLSIP
jgi:hypothetical protein